MAELKYRGRVLTKEDIVYHCCPVNALVAIDN